MKNLRKMHLYLGCIFSPLIIYFALSGAFQIFRLNDLPKDEPATHLQIFFHELAKPHTHSTLPGFDPKIDHSQFFNWISLFMAVGLCLTTIIGLVIAYQPERSRKRITFCVLIGILIPVLLLVIRA